MNRYDAILLISKDEVMKLDRGERESIILNWWGIDNENPMFDRLPWELQQEIVNEEEPLADIMDKKYDHLLIEAIMTEFVGVRNDYLSKRASQILNKEMRVEGEAEILFACPCCQYQTLEERGQYYICPVCFWEDDGNNQAERYSGPNHMTLQEGKNNFSKFGAVTESLAKSIKLDVKHRYSKIG
ncbi:CPCC family cysteine-rich protein [Acetonema longum]|uniref:Cysteine-rich CPCC domain-containing protein n=1 Tax=Acetonema longum DSM 6540 TaxID=1009370 RepID=F7NFA1_9FIRM|nr:CPCC family cysteine-rich protein [Acetonema longum]EGO65281.1 hypothetical protein ALO_03641 [Acetonema longum DSM 6540]